MRLLNDICRCLGEGCDKKETCARFMQWPESTNVSVVKTFINDDKQCYDWIDNND